MISCFGFGRLVTPGPCIICGAPFGACTAESVAHQQARQQQGETRSKAEQVSAQPVQEPAAPAPPANPTFSTKTYRGELKRRRSGGR